MVWLHLWFQRGGCSKRVPWQNPSALKVEGSCGIGRGSMPIAARPNRLACSNLTVNRALLGTPYGAGFSIQVWVALIVLWTLICLQMFRCSLIICIRSGNVIQYFLDPLLRRACFKVSDLMRISLFCRLCSFLPLKVHCYRQVGEPRRPEQPQYDSVAYVQSLISMKISNN